MMNAQCNSCGASVNGLVCDYCGSTNQLIMDLQMQKEALAEYHQILQKQKKVVKAKMLRNGFLPDAPEILMEAGLRVIPLIDYEKSDDVVVKGAVQRLRAIVTKLRLMEPTEQVQAAVAEFESVQSAYARESRIALWVGIALFGIPGLLICAAVIALAIYSI